MTPEERDKFLKQIRDPTSSSTQELLRKVGTELKLTLPWWEASGAPEDFSGSLDTTRAYGNRPTMEEIPRALLSRQTGPDGGPPLLYNICAVLYVA